MRFPDGAALISRKPAPMPPRQNAPGRRVPAVTAYCRQNRQEAQKAAKTAGKSPAPRGGHATPRATKIPPTLPPCIFAW